MSLADVNPLPRRDRPQGRLQDGDARTLRRPDLDGIVGRVFGFDTAKPASRREPEPEARNFDVAFQALRRGAANLDELQVRCERLQSELGESAERHRLELDGVRHELARWQTLAQELSDKLERSQLQLADAERLSAVQDDRVEAEARRADAAERRTHSFERITLAFHDSIVDVFRDCVAPAS